MRKKNFGQNKLSQQKLLVAQPLAAPTVQQQFKSTRTMTNNSGIFIRSAQLDLEMDPDKLFIMSLLQDFRDIPQRMKLATKLELFSIIKAATSPETMDGPLRRTADTNLDYGRVKRHRSIIVKKKNISLCKCPCLPCRGKANAQRDIADVSDCTLEALKETVINELP